MSTSGIVVLYQDSKMRVILDLLTDQYKQESKSRFLGRWRTDASVDRAAADRALDAGVLNRRYAAIEMAVFASRNRK